MKRRLFLGPLLSVSALVVGALVLTPTVSAAGVTMKQYGWWVAGTSPVDNTPAGGPYSGADGADLHVAYGPNTDGAESSDVTSPVNGPVEISAALWTLGTPVPADTASNIPVAVIKLPVDTTFTPAASPQSSLLACAALNPWGPVQGGNWNSRVTYNPGSACAPGQPDAAGTTFSFTITAGMLKDQGATIDLAIVPGFTPIGVDTIKNGQTSPPEAPWSIDLKPPTADDVAVQPVAGGTGIGGGFSVPDLSSSTVPTLAGGLPGAAPVAAPPSQGPAGSVAPVNRVPTNVAANPAARLNALTRSRLVAAALLMLVFLGGLMLMLMDVQKYLTPAGQTAGIGRFARPRTGPPLPI